MHPERNRSFSGDANFSYGVVRQRRECSTGVYRDGAGCAASRERRPLFEIARRPGERGDAHVARNSDGRARADGASGGSQPRRRQHRRPLRPRRLRRLRGRKLKRPSRIRTEGPRGRVPPAHAAKASALQGWGGHFLWWVEAARSKSRSFGRRGDLRMTLLHLGSCFPRSPNARDLGHPKSGDTNPTLAGKTKARRGWGTHMRNLGSHIRTSIGERKPS